ncbi:MAG: tRNA lysidine(34) synthetase TilS [Dehalococcoidia bacterium]|jgi:tRNA(Ile)-lysidine synthase|nr:tRNA lysidine(34) synthetase TilS [Dehalococcoidia bacterium]
MKTGRDLTAATLECGVLTAIRDGTLLRPGSTVVVAVSGGADSLCLLHVLVRLSDRLRLRLHVAHLDHMLRGAASRDDAAFVAATAQSLGLPCTVEARDVAAWKRERKCSLEEAAREVRYRFLHEVACRVGAESVATGHTRDDAVETLLLHVIRGSGLRGLRGLDGASSVPVVSPGSAEPSTVRIVRPLLGVSREETAEYCRLIGLEPRKDASNESPSHLRNRVRLELLPQCRGLNPKFDDALLRLGQAAKYDDEHLEEEARRTYDSIADESPDCVQLNLKGFAGASPAIQARLVRRAHEQVAGDLRDVSAEHVRAVRRLVAARPGKRVHLVAGIVWRREPSSLAALGPHYVDDVRGPEAPLQPVEVPVPGEAVIPGWRVTASLVDGPYFLPGENALTAAFDADLAGRRLFVRRRQPGDRFRPLGMAQEKKLQDFMVDTGIPLAQRDGVPILCSPEHIVWVVGWRIDDRVKVADGTGAVLQVAFLPAP